MGCISCSTCPKRATSMCPKEELTYTQNRITKLKAELKEMKDKAIGQQRVEYVRQEYDFGCRHFLISDGHPVCEAEYDITLCSKDCPFSTNRPGSFMINGKNQIIKKGKPRSIRDILGR